MADYCEHLSDISPQDINIPDEPVCEECVALSAEPTERSAWCYKDEGMMEY